MIEVDRINSERERVNREVRNSILKNRNFFSSFYIFFPVCNLIILYCVLWFLFYYSIFILSLPFQVGYRIMDVQDDSPASRGKLEPLIDLVISVKGKPLRVLDNTFLDFIKVTSILLCTITERIFFFWNNLPKKFTENMKIV